MDFSQSLYAAPERRPMQVRLRSGDIKNNKMKQIGLFSDTHGYLDPTLFRHFETCDEIWHAGDIGSISIVEDLRRFKPSRIVYGNIDSHEIRVRTAADLYFDIEGFSVWITHIGGYPPRYNPAVKKALKDNPPDIFVCGHSHVLRVMRDPACGNLWYINPGAAGKEGFHHMRTAMKFTLDNGIIRDMAVVELGKRGQLP